VKRCYVNQRPKTEPCTRKFNLWEGNPCNDVTESGIVPGIENPEEAFEFYLRFVYKGVSKSFRTESITK